jgi:protein-S-isoprenylcysteine O-methyltransferase Ste14
LNALKEFVTRHPQLTAWFVLAVGMVVILLWSAKDVGLLPSQIIALAVATVLVAGLCVWIISWEDEEPEEVEPANGQ